MPEGRSKHYSIRNKAAQGSGEKGWVLRRVKLDLTEKTISRQKLEGVHLGRNIPARVTLKHEPSWWIRAWCPRGIARSPWGRYWNEGGTEGHRDAGARLWKEVRTAGWILALFSGSWEALQILNVRGPWVLWHFKRIIPVAPLRGGYNTARVKDGNLFRSS